MLFKDKFITILIKILRNLLNYVATSHPSNLWIPIE